MNLSRILPVLRGNYPDPTILRVGPDYFLTHTSGVDVPALLLWHSSDLLRWTPLRAALPHFDGDIWAPELSHHDGNFIYYPTSGSNHVRSLSSHAFCKTQSSSAYPRFDLARAGGNGGALRDQS